MPKKTLSIVKETKNDAIIQLKGNQKSLLTLAEFITTHNEPLTSFAQSGNKKHGRIESRRAKVFEISETSKALDSEWDNISCIIKVERCRKVFNTSKKEYTKSEVTVSYYVSTKTLDAKSFLKIIQGHWGIENKVNHVKDVQFKEDLSRIRVKPGIFSRLRSWALNILRINNIKNVSKARHLNCLNINYAMSYKGIT